MPVGHSGTGGLQDGTGVKDPKKCVLVDLLIHCNTDSFWAIGLLLMGY